MLPAKITLEFGQRGCLENYRFLDHRDWDQVRLSNVACLAKNFHTNDNSESARAAEPDPCKIGRKYGTSECENLGNRHQDDEIQRALRIRVSTGMRRAFKRVGGFNQQWYLLKGI